jgi:hypothetical protein
VAFDNINYTSYLIKVSLVSPCVTTWLVPVYVLINIFINPLAKFMKSDF